MKIGQKIKELPRARGITQEQLAESIGISFQAVSKWENGISLPDITLAPMLASYFGVSMDELFDFSLAQIEAEARAIAQETVQYREHDPEKGRAIIEQGLQKYPENDILLQNLLYLINYSEAPDDTIRTAMRTIDATHDDTIRCDALRFLAYAYKAKGDMPAARAALEQIPGLYFTRLTEMAYVLEGEEKWQAACLAEGNALDMLLEMKSRIAECHLDKGETEKAREEYRQALDVMDAIHAADSRHWSAYRTFFQRRLEETAANA